MSISTFDMFKIGIGPSSSHTVGPMRAAGLFARELLADPELGPRVADVSVHLYGFLAATAVGHGTLDAVVMGLQGDDPETVEPSRRPRTCRADRGSAGGLLPRRHAADRACVPPRS